MKEMYPSLNQPPSKQEVKIYFNQKGMPECEANKFYHFYEERQWTSKTGLFFKNWKNVAYRWIAAVMQIQPFLFDRHIH